MAEIFSIGKLDRSEDGFYLKVNSKYRKGLKGITSFSHLHIFCTTNENKLIQVTSKAGYDHVKEGIITISAPLSNLSCPLELIDIKPYLPSEDYIATEQRSKVLNSITIRPKKSNYSDSITSEDYDTYEVSFSGEIRNTHGETYLQYSNKEEVGKLSLDFPSAAEEYIRIFWWFDKFDDKKYRNILQCNPPYESSDKIGVFACRAPIRPNPIAITNARITRIDETLRRIYVNGIESFDHTPFIGIADYDATGDRFGRENVVLPEWARGWPDSLDLRDNIEKTASIDEIAAKIDFNEKMNPIIVENANMRCHHMEIATKSEDQFRSKSILVKGAREHNLKNVSVSIPYNAITAVVGVSGSGKSSLVMDTIYAECHRRMEHLSSENTVSVRPNMDTMTGCIPTVMISQKEIRSNSNSTIGTFSGIYNHLRSIYASIGVKNYVDPNQVEFKITPSTFSFLDSECRCSFCNGKGKRHSADLKKIITKPNLSLLEGASPFLGKLRTYIDNPNANWMKGQVVALANEMKIDLSVPWSDLDEGYRELVLNGDENRLVEFDFDNKKNGRKGNIKRPLEGIIPIINRLYIEDDKGGISEKFMSEETCSICHGERLAPVGRLVTVLGVRYPVAASLSFDSMYQFMLRLQNDLSEEKLGLIEEQINAIIEICIAANKLGIGYLDCGRNTVEISGGEAQRLKLLSAFLNHMTGILYVFDEPSKKLSSREYGYITNMMKDLINEGNTILMVEHNMDMIKIADYVIEIGPKAGANGGYLVGEGSFSDMIKHEGTMIAKYADNADNYEKDSSRKVNDFVTVNNISVNTLKDVSASFPRNAMTCITGVSGSGKSSLLYGGILEHFEKSSDFSQVIKVESKISGGTKRSVVATYSGIMDDLRMIFASTRAAKEAGYSDSDFSFNKGKLRCEHCKGDGIEKIPFTENSYRPCPVCHGSRYSKEAMKIKWNDYSITDILNMSVDEINELYDRIIHVPKTETFDNSNFQEKITEKCRLLSRVGLGYVTLSQSTSTLSGGEAARLKIASCLMTSKMNNALLLLDEPTCGLHFSDIDNLISLLYEIIDSGNTVVAIEHNKRFLSAADYMITMGPGSGNQGGEIVRSCATS